MSEINVKIDSLEEVLKDVLYCSIVDYISLVWQRLVRVEILLILK